MPEDRTRSILSVPASLSFVLSFPRSCARWAPEVPTRCTSRNQALDECPRHHRDAFSKSMRSMCARGATEACFTEECAR
ncbi:hypothetical protein Nepgr_008363 [Nepenthes gracilis]|uniref:Uncharacterized protein n=1 Tax=Nepenthes gracilis TaxID=150966 RepID=A0AAD3XJ68_NEPGR|nr:hypothetical protein Nepgr_008363 [Nepenthes gracilis]